MLSISVVEEIAEHLAEGKLSQRAIARRLGVSRATVSAIVHGKRGLYGRSEEVRMSEPNLLAPPQRCPKCGYRIHLPCLICRTREYRRGRQILGSYASGRSKPPREVRTRPIRLRRRRCRNVAA